MTTFITNKKIPIFFANFVLMDYGTGAIFGCPAHDQRDFDFAKKYKLEIIQVVSDGKETLCLFPLASPIAPDMAEPPLYNVAAINSVGS